MFPSPSSRCAMTYPSCNLSATRYPPGTLRNEYERGKGDLKRGFVTTIIIFIMQHIRSQIKNFLSAREQAAERKEIVKRQLDLPRRDKRQRLAVEGTEYATGYLNSSPCHYQPAVFRTPDMDLEMFILQLLSSLGSLEMHSAHAGTLALMGRIVESGICPKASSSPHHLFLAAFLAVQRATTNARTDNQRLITLTERSVPLEETLAVLREVEDAVEARGGLLAWALHDDDVKTPTQVSETSSEVIDLGGTRSALREIVTTKYTTGKTTTAVSSSRVYRLKAVRGKLVCDRSDVFSPPPSHVTYFLS